jgi:hypothetical protein
MAQLPLARQIGLIIEEIPGEILVYDSERDSALCLNRTVALVWKHCDGKTTHASMAKLIEQELQVTGGDEIVSLALDRLEKAHLLTAPPKTKFSGITRRELVRRLGVSAAALPVIAMIQTQPAGQIASCVQLGGGCELNGDCCSGCCIQATCAPSNNCFGK